MEMEILRGELERLFSLDELTALSNDLLGFDPQQVGGTAAKASFAKALTDLCAEVEAVDALVEAILASRTDVSPELKELATSAPKDELATGATFGPFVIGKKLGEGPLGVTYTAKQGDRAVVVKVLRAEAVRDRRALHRFLTATRLVARVEHDALPRHLSAGLVEGAGRWWVAYDLIDGQPLSARIARTGPMHVNEARPLLKGIAEALAALHDRRLAHGNLKPENVLVARGEGGQPKVVLVDAAADRLRQRARAAAGDVIATVGSPKTMAPEQVRGRAADAATDVYAFGALLYEVLTGKPVFSAATPLDAAVAHLTKNPEPPSTVAPRGWVTAELDQLVLSLLAKDPALRPRDGRALAEKIESVGKAKKAVAQLAEGELEARIEALRAAPEDDAAALKLETSIDEGADAAQVASAFADAAASLEVGEDAAKREAKKALLFRAARAWDHAKDAEKAEQTYAAIVEIDPADEVASASLERVRRDLGKFEEIVEMLLARSEEAGDAQGRARAMAEIGRIYAHELDDASQALVAYCSAFTDDPETGSYADEIERLAGTDATLWGEAVAACAASAQGELPAEAKTRILERLGRWYEQKLSRADLALPCWQAIVATDPSHDGALTGMSNIYRRAQQWPELGTVLLRRADCAATPARARDLRAEAAELLETKLNDDAKARDIYQQILDEDPGHARASDALARILERTGDFAGFVAVLEKRAEALRGEEKLETLARIAEVYDDRLGDVAEAVRRYESILALDEKSLAALKGLDRIYSRTGKYREMLHVLERQVAVAATPRQKIGLWERIAGVWDEEFLDHEKAAEACQAILALDGDNDAALTALARHLRSLGRWEDVAATLERHLQVTQDDARRLELLLARARVLADQVGSPERAMRAYEQVVELDPSHAGALEALARLREVAGDTASALSAIEALAAKATTPEAKAEQWIRAAKLLDARGDKDGAIQRFKLALDASPGDRGAAAALRAAYTARGDASAAVELIQREIDQAEGVLEKARLHAEAARLLKERIKDEDRARESARLAVELDPTNVEAVVLLGDLAYEAQRYLEAATHYDQLATRVEAMDTGDAKRVLVRYVDALSKSGGSTQKAVEPIEVLLRIAADDPDALLAAAKVTFEHGDPRRSWELHRDLVERFADHLIGHDRAQALYRLGESARRVGDLEAAIAPLQDAAEMDPLSAEPATSLAAIYEAQGNWEQVVRVKTRRLDVETGDARYQLLLELGELLSGKLGDRTRAAKTYVAALEEHPDDRKLLTKLMQLYSEEKDWSKLVDVVLRLADFVEDGKQKAKYVHTAAIVTSRQIGDSERALEFYARVLELDPALDKAVDEAIELRRAKGDHLGVEQLLKARLDRAHEAGDRDGMLATFGALADVYHHGLGWIGEAIDAYEAAQTLDPDDRDRAEILAGLYASDPEKYLDKAVASQRAALAKNPFRPESYKLLRKLYTDAKHADAAFCLCQALSVLNLAEPDEERFFRRMRAETAAPAQDRLTDETWSHHLVHEDADPILTALFALIEPAIIASRSQSLEAFGYPPAYAIDLASDAHPMSQMLYYAAGVLGMAPPTSFQNPNDPGGFSFLHASTPAIVLGQAALAANVSPQAAAFLVARHVAYYRPGLYVRQLVPTGTGLKAWLFAAIKVISPQFPVSPDIEGAVQENMAALGRALVGPARDQLGSLVSKLLSGGGALDLKRWVAAVDITADRAGFLVAHDLETATEVIKASGEDAAAVPVKERLKELVLFGVSEPYFELRKHLGIGVDA